MSYDKIYPEKKSENYRNNINQTHIEHKMTFSDRFQGATFWGLKLQIFSSQLS